MSRRHEDGSVTFSAAEVGLLESYLRAWHAACDQPGADTATPIVNLAIAVRVALRREE